jgi:hypothetical protein
METKQTLIERFTSIDKKFPWSFLGFTFGFLFFLGGLYLSIAYTKSPGFRFELINEGPVYDLKENLSRLEVLFDGESIKQKQQILSYLNIKISNDGNANLSIGSFDKGALPNFSVPDSKIITLENIGASSDYLKHHAVITLTESNNCIISPVIMEQGEYFTFRLLVLHPDRIQPTINLDGKIEGIKKLSVTKPLPPEEVGFLAKAFGGEPLIQVVRIGGYLIGGILFIVLMILISFKINHWRENLKRKKVVSKFKNAIDIEIPKRIERLLSHYQLHGDYVIINTCRILRDSDTLSEELEAHKVLPKATPFAFEQAQEGEYVAFEGNEEEFRRLPWHLSIMQILLDEGIVINNENGVKVDPDSLDLLNRFESFLLAFSPPKSKRRSNSAARPGQDSESTDSQDEGTPTSPVNS